MNALTQEGHTITCAKCGQLIGVGRGKEDCESPSHKSHYVHIECPATTKPATDPAVKAGNECYKIACRDPDSLTDFIDEIRQAYAPILAAAEEMATRLESANSAWQYDYPIDAESVIAVDCQRSLAAYRALVPKE